MNINHRHSQITIALDDNLDPSSHIDMHLSPFPDINLTDQPKLCPSTVGVVPRHPRAQPDTPDLRLLRLVGIEERAGDLDRDGAVVVAIGRKECRDITTIVEVETTTISRHCRVKSRDGRAVDKRTESVKDGSGEVEGVDKVVVVGSRR